MTVKIVFETDTDAFNPYQEIEICDTLNRIIDRIELGIMSSSISDSNGNRIGYYEVD